MARYFSNLSYQQDSLTNSYPSPGEQNFVSFSKTPEYPNQTPSDGSFSEMLSRNSWFPQNFVEMPCEKGRNYEMAFIPPANDTSSHNEKGSEQAGFINGERNYQFQGLSLSLGSQMKPEVSGFHNPNMGFFSFSNTHFQFDGNKETMGNPECLPSGFTGGFANNLFNSKYLKAVQQLLDEVVSVQKALDKHQNAHGIGLDDSKDNVILSDKNETAAISSSELSPTERMDLKNKKTKLLTMLNEVNRRYREYYHQMKTLVSSFEMVAGCGAAKPYTTLALQTISRQFRSLRDAISRQIQATQSCLGEQDSLPNEQGEVIPRLRFVDQQLRQQRNLQHLGVMRQAWRPQRGLPENSVTILRAWLFEHFLHPYPKDSEKIMLARQTGLTKNQVANWFINARVRLWKPMVEDMHKEEFGGDVELNSKSCLENAQDNSLESENRGGEELLESDHIPNIDLKRQIEKPWFLNDYRGDDITDSGKLTFQGDQGPGFIGHNIYGPDSSVGPDQADYHCIDPGTQQDRFGNPHVLHDFVV